ncbi:MAG: hypothetical protein AAF558_11540, partial [Verrucomicrobiota bacterium]
LKNQKRPGESFSSVVRRAELEPKRGMTGIELIEYYKKRGPILTEEDCNLIEELNRNDSPPDIYDS